MIAKLYEASNAGVQIKMIVRGVCCIIPGVKNMSENISVIRIVDRYLEHGRVFIFNNNNSPLVFIGSADWMNKSMYRRVEVCFPVYDEKIRQQMIQLMTMQLEDNAKAVLLNEQMQNISLKPSNDQPLIRSQEAIYNFLKV